MVIALVFILLQDAAKRRQELIEKERERREEIRKKVTLPVSEAYST